MIFLDSLAFIINAHYINIFSMFWANNIYFPLHYQQAFEWFYTAYFSYVERILENYNTSWSI